jgi:bifunctional non-homologous end joining protein LigD
MRYAAVLLKEFRLVALRRKPVNLVPKRAVKAGYPGFIAPSLPTLRSTAPASSNWLHEIKLDGYRLQAHIRAGKTKLFTRNGLDWSSKFGTEILAALLSLAAATAIIDGEIVVETPLHPTDFSALQADLSEGRFDRLVFYAFDLLYLDGHDLRPVPLIDRRQSLQRLLASATAGLLRFSEHFEESGEVVFRHARRLGLEGIVSKRRDAPYRSGRGKDWIKAKCGHRQDFVVAGLVPSTTGRKAVGSLVLGYYREAALVYAGRVGTGFSHRMAEELFAGLAPLRIPKSPFTARLTAADSRKVTFLQPRFVVEVEFRGWTSDGVIRHASFRGVREDKASEEVVRET